MKHLPVVILLIALALMAAVTGCGDTSRYDGRLAQADSLMRDCPDSALALLEGLDTAAFATAGDSAYRDLLMTQARYRCYVTATSDTAINRALAYYRAHPKEREKLTRAYIYKGAVMEELGHPDSAMLYYKHAEATADTTDYFNLGYTNMRIAQLYQRLYINDSLAFDRIKQATHYFSITKDTFYLITTIGTQGIYLSKSNKDSSCFYLLKAISLADAIKSAKRYKYESKLAGIYFYQEEYVKAKNLAMDIIRNGRNDCDENNFYYYAARSFIKLSMMDSAYWVESIIPEPITSLDSMNHYILQADISETEHNFRNYVTYTTRAKEISNRQLYNAIKSNVREEELKMDTNKQKDYLKISLLSKFSIVITSVIFLLILSFFIARKQIKDKILAYQTENTSIRHELEQEINNYEKRIEELELMHGIIISQKDNELEKLNRMNAALRSKHQTIHQQVLEIVRTRKSVLNELYQAIRVKASSGQSSKKHPLPLLGLIKDLNDQKKLLHIIPRDSFWERLKQSIDLEFNGIASFVEKKYPSIEEKDFQLFLLLCADVSPQIIKLCLGYDHAVTVSNYKIRLVKKIFGVDVKFDDYIQMYLKGILGSENNS